VPDSGELDLVAVLETVDAFALTEAKAALDEADIAYVVSAPDFGFLPGWYGTAGIGTLPLDWKGHSTVLVPRESYQAARALLETFAAPPTEEAS